MSSPFANAAAASPEPRRPHFMSGAANEAPAHRAFEAATQADGVVRRASLHAQPPPAEPVTPPPPAPAPAAESISMAALAAEIDSLRKESAAHLASAIEKVQLSGARMAEEARADVLELAFQIARRILDGELRAGHEALFALVRGAVRRVGEARRISVRLNPQDAAAVQVARDTGDAAVVSLTRVELVPDPTIAPGDCVVDSDAGTVDGRLASRIQELRRAVEQAAEESAA